MSTSDEEPFEGFAGTSSANAGTTRTSSPRGTKRKTAARNPGIQAANTPSEVLAEQFDFDQTPEAARCLLCEEINPHKTPYMVKCDQCGLWCHFRCAGVSRRQVDNIPWHCPKCLDPENIADLAINNDSHVPEDIASGLAKLKRSITLYKRIPKPMRGCLAGILNDRIQEVINRPSKCSWWNLLTFPFCCLQKVWGYSI